MYDKDRALNFSALKGADIIMSSADAVECLLDFSKGPEAVVTKVHRQPYIGPVETEEASNYTVLEANRKPIPPIGHSPPSNQPHHPEQPKPRAICSFCGKSFSHLGDHNKHRRRHTGERPYPCDLCPRRFAHASNLARHRRLHSGEKPFECTNCSRRFSRKDKLAAHVARRSCCKNLPPTVTRV
ncbi:hypothetical protein TSAR_016187 [Trichomalopsis sarcophagae]|uniref:C2H2-type domain-containing protein n=1 Tax=Trichomalopsis sarcophagae TaxID=543379 RepID=A0A232FAN1_9HYME|nr:hypothetical protein TSAR_016187 [Trichomalopsis sarcophagae]